MLVKQTAAYELVIDPATQNAVLWVIEVDPSILTAGYDCIYLGDSGGHANNFCDILFVGQPRFAQASLPAAITGLSNRGGVRIPPHHSPTAV